MFRYCSLLSLPLFFFFTTEFINILVLSLKREGGGGEEWCRQFLLESGFVREDMQQKNPMTFVLNISASPFVVHTCMWLDITGLRFVLSQSVKHFILSRYTSNLVCIPISVFSTLAFYRPHNNSISLFEKATFQFRCCKTSLVEFMSYSPVKPFYHVLFRLPHFLECTHHKLSGI